MSKKTVLLKNGDRVPKPIVDTVFNTLEGLWHSGLSGMLAVYDLKQLCDDSTSPVDPASIETLKRYALLDQNGKVHVAVRGVVQSALSSLDGDLQLVSPVAEVQAVDAPIQPGRPARSSRTRKPTGNEAK